MSAQKIFYLAFLFFPLTYLNAQLFNSDMPVDSLSYQVRPDNASISIDKNGNIGITYSEDISDSVFFLLPWRVKFAKSTDRGETFSTSVIDDSVFSVNGMYSKISPRIVFDSKNNIWVSYVYQETRFGSYYYVLVCVSTDGGNTFSDPMSIAETEFPNLSPSISADNLGNVFLIWASGNNELTCTKFVNGNINNRIETQIDLGDLYSWDEKIFASNNNENIYVIFYYWSKIYFIKSSNSGLNFSYPIEIDSAGFKPDIFVNKSGVINIAYVGLPGYRLYYANSTDEGETFQHKYVNENMNINYGPVTYENEFGIFIAWPNSYMTFFTYSVDNGETFSEPARVGNPLYHNFLQAPRGIISDDSGYTYILFSDFRSGKEKLYISREKFNLVSIDKNKLIEPEAFALYQNYPNPFNPVTKIKFRILGFGFVNLRVYDILGKEVAKLVSEEKTPGEYEIEFDASHLSSGVYFYKLTSGDFNAAKKFVLMK